MQSFAKQPSYSTYAKYSRVGTSKVYLLLPAQKNISAAMKSFAEFFKDKTGKAWESRADGKIPPPKCNDDGEPLPVHEGWYTLEIHGNIFTNYFKSYQDPSDPTVVDFQDKVNPVSDSDAKNLDGASEGLSQSHALLESLILMEFGRSTTNEPEEENNTPEESSELITEEVVEKSK